MSPSSRKSSKAARATEASSGTRREGAGVSMLATLFPARRSSGTGGPGSGSSVADKLLTEDELAELEEQHVDGITAVEVVELFRSRGLRFSEATFRKYVQQGLLPRSRRVGRKGKHRGSMGVYPAKTVRRINAIKLLMADGYTIEEIEEQFLRFIDVIETLEEGMEDVFGQLAKEAESPRFDTKARTSFEKEIDEARRTADELLRRISGLSERVTASRRETHRSTGAAGSAEDLL